MFNPQYAKEAIAKKRLEIKQLQAQIKLWDYLSNDLDFIDEVADMILSGEGVPKSARLTSEETGKIIEMRNGINSLEAKIYNS